MDTAARIEKLRLMGDQVRIGGRGSARRKKKVIHKSATTDDKKLQGSLKKMGLNPIQGIDEVNMFKDDGTVIHFKQPKVQASLQANTFALSGTSETKQITDMLGSVWNQLGPENFDNLKKLAEKMGAPVKPSDAEGNKDDEDEIPELIGDFDEQSKPE